MKKIFLLLSCLILSVILYSQNTMLLHTGGQVIPVPVSETDSMFFTNSGTVINFRISGNLTQYNTMDIDSITFNLSPADSSIYITYSGNTVTVVNPLESAGVTVTTEGAKVTVNSIATLDNINYVLAGATTDGTFKVYSEERYYLSMNGVSITNPDGPAVNNQSDKRVTVILVDATNNFLTDGLNYADPPIGPGGDPEDQDAAFFSEGQLVFTGTGSLQINGLGIDEHAIRSDDYIRVQEGNITISGSANDGIHANDGFYQEGGSISITAAGDGIDAGTFDIILSGGTSVVHCNGDDVSGIKCDSTLTISGGTVSVTMTGDNSEGLKSGSEAHLTGGIINISSSGNVVLTPSGSGNEVSYCSAIKGETLVLVDGCDLTITSSAEAGRGITCNGEIVIISGTVEITASGDGDTYANTLGQNDAYHGACLNADGNISLTGGTIILSHSGDAGKGITVDTDLFIGNAQPGPVLSVTTTGQNITISGGPNGQADEAKTIKANGNISIESGSITIDSNDDGIKTGSTFTMNGGTITITNSEEGIEGPNLILNGGEVSLTSHDDGFNATYGNGGEANDGSLLEINGGYAFINSTNGDPLDSNGNIHINGGVIVVHGPQSSPEVGMDVNGSCIITGGFLVVSGTNSNMTENASSSSTQRSILFRTNQQVSANTIFHVEDNAGNSLLNFAPMRSYYSIIFSSAELTQGTTYKVYTGGTCNGTLLHGLYTGGTYTGGTLKTTFTLTTMTPTVWF